MYSNRCKNSLLPVLPSTLVEGTKRFCQCMRLSCEFWSLFQLGRCISRVRIVLERSRVGPSNFHVLLPNATGTNNETTQGLFKSSLCPKPLTTLQPPTVVYSEPLQCFYHYRYRCICLSLAYTCIRIVERASIMRFSAIATALLAPLCAQANVMFTNNEYSGIADGVPFTLAWSGDGTVSLFARLLRSSC